MYFSVFSKGQGSKWGGGDLRVAKISIFFGGA